MTSKHTSGPWSITRASEHPIEDGPTLWVADIGVRGRASIARIQSSDHCVEKFGIGREEMQANAALIAAAPDMLAALKACADGIESNGTGNGGDVLISEAAWRAALAAVAEAEGRS